MHPGSDPISWPFIGSDPGCTGGYGGSSPREIAGLRARYDGGFCHRARNLEGYGGSSPREKRATHAI